VSISLVFCGWNQLRRYEIAKIISDTRIFNRIVKKRNAGCRRAAGFPAV
jgi:hypothetical protein